MHIRNDYAAILLGSKSWCFESDSHLLSASLSHVPVKTGKLDPANKKVLFKTNSLEKCTPIVWLLGIKGFVTQQEIQISELTPNSIH